MPFALIFALLISSQNLSADPVTSTKTLIKSCITALFGIQPTKTPEPPDSTPTELKSQSLNTSAKARVIYGDTIGTVIVNPSGGYSIINGSGASRLFPETIDYTRLTIDASSEDLLFLPLNSGETITGVMVDQKGENFTIGNPNTRVNRVVLKKDVSLEKISIVELRKHTGRDPKKHLELLEKYNLQPKHFFLTQNAKYTFSDFFKMPGGRIGVIALVEVGDQTYYRVFYRSNSSTGFRLLPARNSGNMQNWKPGFDKAEGEESLALPLTIKIHLARLLEQAKNIVDATDDVHEQGVPVLETIDTYVAYEKKRNNIKNIVRMENIQRNPKDAKRYLETQNGWIFDPRKIELLPGKEPDFSSFVVDYITTSALAGPLKAYVYRSKDKTLYYTVYRDYKDRIWFDDVTSAISPISIYGVPELAINAGELTTPLWEYKSEVVPEFRGVTNPLDSRYVLNWPFIKQIPYIGAWYKANNVAMPGE